MRKTVELAEDNVNWFYDTYGEISNNASLSWVLDLMLEQFRKAHDKTPQEYAVIGAAALKEMLQSKGAA